MAKEKMRKYKVIIYNFDFSDKVLRSISTWSTVPMTKAAFERALKEDLKFRPNRGYCYEVKYSRRKIP